MKDLNAIKKRIDNKLKLNLDNTDYKVFIASGKEKTFDISTRGLNEWSIDSYGYDLYFIEDSSKKIINMESVSNVLEIDKWVDYIIKEHDELRLGV